MTEHPDTRIHAAWLLWCISEGYVNAEDRAKLTNWLALNPATLHHDDAALRPNLLAMADELLDHLAGPVGKLQAENEALLKHLLIADALVLKLTLRLADKVGELADPERIRREAIGTARTGWAVIDRNGRPSQTVWNSTDGAYGEAETTGWRRIAPVRLTVEGGVLDTSVGMLALRKADAAVRAALAAGESAVTGEAT